MYAHCDVSHVAVAVAACAMQGLSPEEIDVYMAQQEANKQQDDKEA